MKTKGSGHQYVPTLVHLDRESVAWMDKRVARYKKAWFVRQAVKEKIERELSTVTRCK